MSSKVISRDNCPLCGSKDNFVTFDNGSRHCFTPTCTNHVHPEEDEGGYTDSPSVSSTGAIKVGPAVAALDTRRISKETCSHFGVTVEFGLKGKIEKHFYPYYHPETGELIASKVRQVSNKNFYATGDLSSGALFGQNKCSGKGKFITITEGELDALSCFEMFGKKFDVVSLKAGASAAEKEIKANLEFLEGYDQVVLCFDNDKAGNLAVEQVKDIFSPNKLRICKLPLKDASEMLMANEVVNFTKAWWDSKVYRPDGIVAGEDTWDALVTKRKVKSTPYPWEGLNTITKGHRPYELVTVTSGSGMGKSQFIRELEFDLLKRTDANIGVLALEEDVPRTTLGIMSVAANRPLHLEEDTPVDDLRPYWESTLGTGRYYLFDHWGSTSTDNLLSRVRYMAKALDCRYVILDHLSIVVSGQDNADERKAIDEIMTKLRTLVAETGIGLFLVSHLKRVTGKAHEDGGSISLQDLRGSQTIAQLSDIVIGMERNQQHEDPLVRNTTCVRILKNRYTGQTGPACWLRYDIDTGRMTEVPAPSFDDKEVDF
jgi:twinkle protein